MEATIYSRYNELDPNQPLRHYHFRPQYYFQFLSLMFGLRCLVEKNRDRLRCLVEKYRDRLYLEGMKHCSS